MSNENNGWLGGLLNSLGKTYGGNDAGEGGVTGYQAIGSGFNALNGLFNAYQGIRGLNLAEDQFDFQRGLAQTNLANQAKLVNADLEATMMNRLKQRGLSSDELASQLSAFMDKNSVKGTI